MDKILNSKQIQSYSTKQVSKVGKEMAELNQKLNGNSLELKNPDKFNSLNDIKNSIKYAGRQEQTKDANKHSAWSKVWNLGSVRFGYQFTNKTAHDFPKMKMKKSRLTSISNYRSASKPAKFSAVDMSTGLGTERLFAFGENNIAGLTEKEHSLDAVHNYAVNHPWKHNQVPAKLFRKYPKTMQLLSISDQNYYKDALKTNFNKTENVPKGLYKVGDVDYGGLMGNVKDDEVTPDRLATVSHNMKHTIEHDHLQNEDLNDMISGNSDNLIATTSPNFRPTNYRKPTFHMHIGSRFHKPTFDKKAIDKAGRTNQNKSTTFGNNKQLSLKKLQMLRNNGPHRA